MQKRTSGPEWKMAQGRLAGAFTLAVFLGACAAPPPMEPDVDPDPQENTAPTASAGSDITASVGISVRLSGTGADADGDAITYGWELDVPDGSAATLNNATSATPWFKPDVPGVYGSILIVNDGTADSAPDEVAITAEDNTSMSTIGPAGGEVTSQDGTVSVRIPPLALDADVEFSLTPLASSQIGALGQELVGRLMGVAMPFAFKLDIGEAGDSVSLLSPGTITLQTVTTTTADTTGVTVPEIVASDRMESGRVGGQRTVVDLDEEEVLHSGEITGAGYFAFVGGQLELNVSGFPEEPPVGESFTATTAGEWVGDGTIPEEVEVETVTDGVVSGPSPASAVVRSDVVAGTFVTDFEYVCEEAGTGRVTLLVTSLAERGDPTDENLRTLSIEKSVTCFPVAGEGFTLGLRTLPDRFEPEAVATVWGPLGPITNAQKDAMLFSGNEGWQIRGLSDNRVIVDGIDVASTNPLTRIAAVTQENAVPVTSTDPPAGTWPSPGPDTPAALFGAGVDFGSPTEPMGGQLYHYDPETGMFADMPVETPGAYWDVQTAGGMVTDEIVAATNYGVDFLQWDGITWSHAPDDRLPLSRYGIPGNLAIGSAAAAEAFGPLLVVVSYHRGDPGRLFFDDRGEGGPIDIGVLGVSPAMIKCTLPVCVSVQARDDAIRTILWDGETQPTIVGDPIPVGFDPGAVAVFRVTDNLTLAATFTGFTDHGVTLTELDDDAVVLSSTTMDLGALGCLGPRNGDWLPNPLDPNDPYLVIACRDSNAYYLTLRSAF